MLVECNGSKQLLQSAKVRLITVDTYFAGCLQGLWILETMWECGEDGMLAEAWMALLPATWFPLLFLQVGANSTTLHLTRLALPPPGALTLSLPKLSPSRREQFGPSTSTGKLLTACLCWRFFFSQPKCFEWFCNALMK